MSRSNSGHWWYLACKTLRLREIWLPIVGFAISFVWIGHALTQYQMLYKTLQKPAVIQAELQQNLQDDLRLLIQSQKGVEALTVYTEGTAVMQWANYSGEVPVYYVESNYMRWLARQSASNQISFSEGMPYAIISEKALENLTREKKESSLVSSMEVENDASETGDGKKNRQTDQLILSENDLMQDFTLNTDQTVRLYGLIQNEEMPGVYLSDQWEGEENDAEKTPVKLLIAVKNGFAVPSVIQKLSAYQVDAKSNLTDEINQTNDKNLSLLETGGIILVCAICMMVTGERMWQLKHRKWLEDIRRFAMQPNSDKKVMRRRRLVIIGLGLLGSFLWQWLSVLYGWL